MHVAYLEGYFDRENRASILDEIEAQFKDCDFDSFAVSGVSGLLIGTLAAERMGKGLIVVRKGESCHSDTQIECSDDAHKFVIIDDLCCTGETLQRIVDQIAIRCAVLKFNMPCEGVFLYDCFLRRIVCPYVYRGEDMRSGLGVTTDKLTCWPSG